MTLNEAKERYSEKVSNNFQLWEFVYSKAAEQKGIDNSPSGDIIANIKRLAILILQPLRAAFGKSIAIASKGGSGYRCEELNTAVGGSATSSHRFGLAADCHVDKPIELLKVLLDTGVEFDQAIVYPTFLHIGLKNSSNRKQVLYNKSYKGKRLK